MSWQHGYTELVSLSWTKLSVTGKPSIVVSKNADSTKKISSTQPSKLQYILVSQLDLI